MADKFYEVRIYEKTVNVIVVKASDKEEAQTIADDANHDYGEIIDRSFKSKVIKKQPLGTIVQTRNGYIDPSGIEQKTC